MPKFSINLSERRCRVLQYARVHAIICLSKKNEAEAQG